MQQRTRSARLAASLLSAVVAVLAFTVPSRSSTVATAGPAAARAWVAAAPDATAGSPGRQRPAAHGPHPSYGKDGPRAVHATAAHLHHLQIPHPPGPGTAGTGTHDVPHRALGGPDARLHPATPPTRFADAAPEPRGPPSRRS
ncbi:hypothetical protein [Streptomyces silvensis]|uniref:Secreted protein n=1 Tax=Streptomyces silvensis TaxID=1765722 RepID=A0A0W7X543_9ACTN|nr:hypothetical protein [Streptomyces silvensis]KUF17965.1 hypothetical protein AT728_20095 [Streptomyces silvensis]